MAAFETYNIFGSTNDAMGRSFELVRLPEPEPWVWGLCDPK